MAWGTMAVDWETRVDYDRLRRYRLDRAREQLDKHEIGAFLCFEFYNIRYITAAHIGEWARDKMNRYVLLPRGQEPILFEMGTAALAHKLHSPWIADRVRYALPTWTRSDGPKGAEIAENLAHAIKGILQEYGLQKEPLGVDVADVVFLHALQRALTCFRNPEEWQAIQTNGMYRDFSWQLAAEQYLAVYRSLA